MLVNLASPSKESAALMQELGLQFFDSSGKMKDLAGISQELKTHLASLTDEQRTSALATLFGKEAISAAAILYQGGSQAVEDYTAKVNVAGSAAENGAKRNNNLKGSLQALSSAWETLTITAGNAFIPAIRGATDGITAFVANIIPLIASFLPGFIAGLQSVIAVASQFGGRVLSAVQAVFGAFQALLSGQINFSQFAGGIEAMVSAIVGKLGGLAGQAGPPLQAFLSSVGAFLTSAVPQIAAQLAIWVQAFVGWIAPMIPGLLAGLGTVIAAIGGFIASVWVPTIVSYATTLGTALSGWIQGTAIPFLQSNMPLWLAALGTFITATALPAIGTALQAIGQAFGNWVGTVALPFLAANLPLWSAALAAWITGTALPAVVTGMGIIGQAMGQWIQDTAIPYLAANLPLWGAAIGTFITGTLIPSIQAFAGPLAAALGDWITTTALPAAQAGLQALGSALGEAVGGAFSALGTAVQAKLGEIGTAIGDTFSGLGSTVRDKLTDVKNAVGDAFSGLGSDVQGALSSVGEAIGGTFSGIGSAVQGQLDNIRSIISGVWNAIPEDIRADLEAIVANIGDRFSAAGAAVDSAMSAIGSAIEAGWSAATAAVSSAMSAVGSAVDAGWSTISAAVTAAMSTLGSAIEAGWSAATATVTSAVAAIYGAVTSAWDSVSSSTAAAWSGFVSAISSFIGQAVAVVQGFGGQVAGALATVAGEASAAAAAIGSNIIAGISGALQAGAGALASIAGNVVRGALDAAKSALGIQSPSKEFAYVGAMAMAGLTEGIDKNKAEAIKASADAASAVAKAAEDVLSALSAISSFDFAKSTPTGDQLGVLTGFTTALVASIQAAAKDFTEKGLAATGQFADAAQKVGGMLKGVLEGLAALANFDFAKNSPTGSAMGWLTFLVSSLVQTMQDAAADFDSAGLDAVGKFSDAAAKVVALAKSATDAFAALSGIRAIPDAALAAFGAGVRAAVTTLAAIADETTQAAATSASKFATAAAGAVDFLGKGVNSLMALATFAAPPVAAIYAFNKSLRSFLNDLALVAEQVTQAAATDAAKFATSASTVLDMLAKGVTALGSLKTYADPPAAAIYAFGKTLRSALNDLALVASQVTQEAATEAATFAASANTVVGMLGNAVSAFLKLGEFIAPTSDAIYGFGKTLRAVIADLALVAEQVTTDAAAAASKFATAAGGAVAIIGNGVDGFTKLLTFVAPSQQAIDNFAYAVRAIVAKFADLASTLSGDGLTAANAFATVAGQVLATVKTGVEAFAGFKGLVIPGQQAIDDLVAGIVYVVNRLAGMAAQVGGDGMRQAATFAATASGVFSAIKGAIDTVKGLGNFKDDATKAFTLLLAGMGEALNKARDLAASASAIKASSEDYKRDMQLAANNFANGAALAPGGGVNFVPALAAAGAAMGDSLVQGARDALGIHSPSTVMAAVGADVVAGLVQGLDRNQADAVKAAAEAATAVAGAISAIFDALTKSQSFKAGDWSGLYAIGKGIRTAVADFSLLAEQVTQEATDAAAKFAEGAGKVASAVGAAADGLAKAASYVAPSSFAGLYNLDKAIRAVVADMAIVAELVTVDAATAAGQFADGAGKVVAILANAVAGFAALATYKDVAQGTIDAFVAAVGVLVRGIAIVAAGLTADGLTLAGQFGEAAAKIVGMLGNAVTGIGALANFRDVAGGTIDAFVRTVNLVVRGIASATQGLAADGLTLAGQFADAGGKIVGIMGNAVSGFAALARFVSPTRATIDAFLATVRYTVARFGDMAAILSTDGTTATAAFADAAGKVLGAVGAGVTAFKTLDETNMPTPGKLDDLVRAVQDTVDRVAVAAGLIGADAIANATAFATAASGIFTALKSGLDLFIQIDKPGNWPTTDWLQPLIELMSGVLARGGMLVSQAEQLRGMAETFSATLGQAFAGFQNAGAGLDFGAMGGGALALAAPVPVGLPSGGGGGGGNTYISVTVTGNTVLGDDFATGAKIAAIVAPEIKRLVGV